MRVDVKTILCKQLKVMIVNLMQVQKEELPFLNTVWQFSLISPLYGIHYAY